MICLEKNPTVAKSTQKKPKKRKRSDDLPNPIFVIDAADRDAPNRDSRMAALEPSATSSG